MFYNKFHRGKNVILVILINDLVNFKCIFVKYTNSMQSLDFKLRLVDSDTFFCTEIFLIPRLLLPYSLFPFHFIPILSSSSTFISAKPAQIVDFRFHWQLDRSPRKGIFSGPVLKVQFVLIVQCRPTQNTN